MNSTLKILTNDDRLWATAKRVEISDNGYGHFLIKGVVDKNPKSVQGISLSATNGAQIFSTFEFINIQDQKDKKIFSFEAHGK